MRDVIVWSIRLVVVFVVLLGVSFVALTVMTPSPEELVELVESTQPAPAVEQPKDGEPADSLGSNAIDSLQAVIESLRNEIFLAQLQADSVANELELKSVELEKYLSQYDGLNQRIKDLTDQNVSVKDLAKTYETMKVNDIRPITEKLDDATIIALYENMGSRTRKNLMMALSSVRAAQITKKIAGAKP